MDQVGSAGERALLGVLRGGRLGDRERERRERVLPWRSPGKGGSSASVCSHRPQILRTLDIKVGDGLVGPGRTRAASRQTRTPRCGPSCSGAGGCGRGSHTTLLSCSRGCHYPTRSPLGGSDSRPARSCLLRSPGTSFPGAASGLAPVAGMCLAESSGGGDGEHHAVLKREERCWEWSSQPAVTRNLPRTTRSSPLVLQPPWPTR